MNVIINYEAADHIYIVCGKTDLRKGIDGLAEIIGVYLIFDIIVMVCYNEIHNNILNLIREWKYV